MPCIPCHGTHSENFLMDGDEKRRQFPAELEHDRRDTVTIFKRFRRLWSFVTHKKSPAQKVALSVYTTESTLAACSRTATPTKFGKRQNLAPTPLDELYTSLQDQAEKIQTLEEDNHNLKISLLSLTESLNNIQAQVHERRPPQQPTLRWAQVVKPQKSPTRLYHIPESSNPPPESFQHDVSPVRKDLEPTQVDTSFLSPPCGKYHPPPVFVADPSSDEMRQQDLLEKPRKNFRVTLDDPTWKVLPAALKKYRVNSDDWQNYAMFISYGATGNRTTRCLSYDEKPLVLFQKLKDAKKDPVFMLKHAKDIPSPLVLARKKLAARQSLSMENTGLATSDEITRNDTSQRRSPTSSPRTFHPSALDASTASNSGKSNDRTSISRLDGRIKGELEPQQPEQPVTDNKASAPQALAIKTFGYAVAIFPYTAEHSDELNVTVNDTFLIVNRARGWWIVRRDLTGSGIGDGPEGWVPAGCLLATSVPMTSAVAEAKSGCSPALLQTLTSKTPISPQRIDSTSILGTAWMDYSKKSDEELDLRKDEVLKVFKRYSYWSYVVKEETGDRGWVPSWFISKTLENGTTTLP